MIRGRTSHKTEEYRHKFYTYTFSSPFLSFAWLVHTCAFLFISLIVIIIRNTYQGKTIKYIKLFSFISACSNRTCRFIC